MATILDDDIQVDVPGREPLFFPAGTDEETIQRVTRNYAKGMFGRDEPAPFVPRDETAGDLARRVGGVAQRKAGVVASEAAGGVSDLVGLPAAFQDATAGARAWFADKLGNALGGETGDKLRRAFAIGEAGARDFGLPGLPQASEVRSAFEPMIPRMDPETVDERIAGGTARLFAGAPVPGAGVPALIGGFTGEAARQVLPGATGLTPETSEAIGRFAGPFAAAGVQAVRRTPGQIIHERGGRDLTPADWARGDANMAEGVQVGVPLLGPEALSSPGLRRLATDVRAHPTAGPIIEAFLGRRPAQVAQAGEAMASTLGPRRDPSEVVADIQQAAEGVMRRVVGARSAAVRQDYDAAEATVIPGPDIDAITDILARGAQNTAPEVAAELAALAAKIRANPTVGAVSKILDMQADAAKTAGTIAATERSPAQKAAQARSASAVRTAEGVMEAVSPSYASAQDTFRRMSPAIDTLTDGPIGALSRDVDAAGIRGAQGLAQRFLIDPATTSPGTIRTITRQLAQERPEAVADFAAQYLRRTLDAASKTKQGGPPSVGSTWFNTIAGTPETKANLRALVEEAATASGQNPSGVGAGLNRLLNVMERTGTVPGIGSPTAGRNEAFRVAEIITRPMSWLQARIQRGAYEDLARALTHPEATRIMRELAVTGPNTGRERMLISAWSNFVAGQP